MKRRHSYLREEGMPTQGKHELTHGVSKATQHLGLNSLYLEATHVQCSAGHVVHDHLYGLWVAGGLCHFVTYIHYNFYTVLQKYHLLYFYNKLHINYEYNSYFVYL